MVSDFITPNDKTNDPVQMKNDSPIQGKEIKYILKSSPK